MATYQLFDFSTFNQKNPMLIESFDFFCSRYYPSFMVILTFSFGHLAIHGIKQLHHQSLQFGVLARKKSCRSLQINKPNCLINSKTNNPRAHQFKCKAVDHSRTSCSGPNTKYARPTLRGSHMNHTFSTTNFCGSSSTLFA